MSSTVESRSRRFIGAVEDEWQLYSNNSSDYTIGLPIGFGASSIVYAAKYQPQDGGQPIPCGIKVLDLDRLPPRTLRLLQNETQLMSLSKHPNVLRVRGSWVTGHKLYIAMRLMNAGSVADVIRYAWPDGLEEEVIRCILKQALQGLNYFHINGLIHRDVKAANLLIDDDGTVLLGDLGVAAFLWDSEGSPPSQSSTPRTVNFNPSSRHSQRGVTPTTLQRSPILGKRKSFVGTPCWMAPEVIDGKQYDASADIWSFGITAIELARGRAPRSWLAPHKVLVMTVIDAPPKLDRSTGLHRYSSAFAEVVTMCLNKDPSQRPTASELLQMNFFKNARKPSYLCNTILKGLPPLTQRQERRKQPSIQHATMDSWDFTSLPASPTTSVYRYPLSLLPPDSVFKMQDAIEEPENRAGKNDADVDGDYAYVHEKSDAEAYALRIMARHRSSGGRNSHSHSRSGSSHSYHAHHHSRAQSHDEPRLSVHSGAEVMVMEAPEGKEIPVLIQPQVATLHAPPLSSSLVSTSSRFAIPGSASRSPLHAQTPPPTSSVLIAARTQPGKLWRKLAGKPDHEPEKEKSKQVVEPPPPTSARKRPFGAVLSRSRM